MQVSDTITVVSYRSPPLWEDHLLDLFKALLQFKVQTLQARVNTLLVEGKSLIQDEDLWRCEGSDGVRIAMVNKRQACYVTDVR